MTLMELEKFGFSDLTQNISKESLNKIYPVYRWKLTENSKLNKVYFKHGIFSKSKILEYFKNKKHLNMIQKIPILDQVEFRVTKYNLDFHLHQELKVSIMSKEIGVMNILTTIIQVLSLCEILNVPHGNISPGTIFKIDKHLWQVAPPLYSTVNLEKKICNEFNSNQYAVNFCTAPEVIKFQNQIEESNFFNLSQK